MKKDDIEFGYWLIGIVMASMMLLFGTGLIDKLAIYIWGLLQ